MKNAFDPEQFAILLKKLIGPRKVQDFAEQAGVSKFQLSRRLKGAIDTPPRKKTLKQFASCAANGVTYAELLDCCGYDTDTDNPALARSADRIRIAKAALLASIGDLCLQVKPSSDDPTLPYDFELMIGTDPEVTWSFSCLPSDLTLTATEQLMDLRFRHLMYARLKAYTKFSFLTENQNIFNACLGHVPVNLNVNVSVILYSPGELKILNEDVLSASSLYPIPPEYYFRKQDQQEEKE